MKYLLLLVLNFLSVFSVLSSDGVMQQNFRGQDTVKTITTRTGHLLHECSNGSYIVTSLGSGEESGLCFHTLPPGATSVTYVGWDNTEYTFVKSKNHSGIYFDLKKLRQIEG